MKKTHQQPSILQRSYSMLPTQHVAFVGLGVMGYPMAGHLASAGHTVTVYNRTNSKAEQWLAEFGGEGKTHAIAATPHLAAQHADVVFSCVGNDNDVRKVTMGKNGVFSSMKAGAVYVEHTTASANLAKELACCAQNLGLHFLDAPVSGGQSGAQKGQLTLMCGGEESVFQSVLPLLKVYSQACTLMGPVGTGQLTKMVNQIAITGVLQGLAEAVAFGQCAGLNIAKVIPVISKGAAQSWQMENRGISMSQKEFDFGFAVDWMRKDLSLILDEAKRNGALLPVTALVDQFYAEVQRMGGSRWDTSSLVMRLSCIDIENKMKNLDKS